MTDLPSPTRETMPEDTRRSLRAAFLFASIVLAFFLPACGDAAANAEGDAPRLDLQLEDLYRVGSIEGTGWEAFARIQSTAFDANGRLYILDAGQYHVVVLDSDGTLVRTIGTRGEGPQELRNPTAMTVLGSGEVAVYDMGHQAFLVYSPQGEFRRSIRAGFQEGMPGTRLWPHGETGVVSISANMVMMTGGSGPPAPPTSSPIRRFDLAGEGEIEVLHEAWIPPRESPAGGGARVAGGGGAMFSAAPMRAFEPQVHLAALPDGRLVVADTSSYRLRLLAPTGAPEDVVEHDVTPRPVGESEQRAERERRLAGFEAGGGQVSIRSGPGAVAIDEGAIRDMLRGQIETMTFWHEIPVITRVSADRLGRIWLARSGGVDVPGPIDILSPDGARVGTLSAEDGPIPDSFGPGDVAAWIETDEFDVQYVQVRRLSGIPRP